SSAQHPSRPSTGTGDDPATQGDDLERARVPVLSRSCTTLARRNAITLMWRSGFATSTRSGDALVITVVTWSGKEARTLREARRMNARAFAARLGEAVASVTNREQRGARIRLGDENQEILDRDLGRASDDVHDRFESVSGGTPTTVRTEGAQRLEP